MGVEETDTMVSLPILGSWTYREWHAVVDGFYCGTIDSHETEYTQEKHYWRIGWLLGDYYDRRFRK